jgi:hypothetical protein
MTLENLTMKQLQAILKLLDNKEENSTDRQNHGIQIVVADRGFIYVGEVSIDAEWVYIQKASNIRLWGTTKGLGELVNGPLANTKLDKTGNLKLSRRALISLISVEENPWKSVL